MLECFKYNGIIFVSQRVVFCLMADNPNHIEKRRYPRIGLEFQVEVEILPEHKILSLISTDISAGGLGISKLAPEGMEIFTEEELFPETRVIIKLLLPGCDRDIDLSGKVAWSERRKSGIWRVGIEFDEPQLEIKKSDISRDLDQGGRRSLKRYSCLFQVEIRKLKEGEIHIGLSANLNSYGMQIFSDVFYPQETPVEIKARIFGSFRKLTLKGKVVWIRQESENTWRLGVVFDEPFPVEKFANL